MGWLESHPGLLRGLLEGHAKLEELQNNVPEVIEEGIIVLGVLLNVRTERLVFDESHVSREHHQGLCSLVFILMLLLVTQTSPTEYLNTYLLGSIPLAPIPLLLKQKPVIIIGEDSR